MVGDGNRDLPLLELHDQVSWEVLLADGVPAQLGRSGELEDLGDGGADELEGVALVASWNIGRGDTLVFCSSVDKASFKGPSLVRLYSCVFQS